MQRFSIALIVLLFFLGACKNKEESEVEHQLPLLEVNYEQPLKMDMQDTVKIYGEIKIRNEAKAASQFGGRLIDFNKLPGDKVEKGERIGTVIPAEREALMQISKNAEDSLKSIMENQVRPIPLYSPIKGTVLSINNHTGDIIQKGEPIMHIGNLSILDVYSDLPIKYLKLVRNMKTMKMKFLSYPHNELTLKIKSIGGNVNSAKQTLTIRLELKNPDNDFYPGMKTLLFFPLQTHKGALTVSRQALVEEEGIFSLFVLKGNKVEKREVKPGIFNRNRVEIINGLKGTEKIVSDKAYSLTDGMEVSVK
jgi:RND family efflux transporter MFP subunit